MDLSGLFPRYINIRRGGYIGMLLSLVLCPWALLDSANSFTAVVTGFTIFFTPVCGIQLADYFFVRKQLLKLSDLYHGQDTSIYYFYHGFNPRTFVAWTIAWVPLVPGLAQTVKPSNGIPDGLNKLYNLAVPYAFISAFMVYLLLNRVFPLKSLLESDPDDVFGTFEGAGSSDTDRTRSEEKIGADTKVSSF
jgi:NCS1 family nucleobase:cation symporter-1